MTIAASELDRIAPFARSVADLALAYDVMQGPDPHDPACAQRGHRTHAGQPVPGRRRHPHRRAGRLIPRQGAAGSNVCPRLAWHPPSAPNGSKSQASACPPVVTVPLSGMSSSAPHMPLGVQLIAAP